MKGGSHKLKNASGHQMPKEARKEILPKSLQREYGSADIFNSIQ